ncbi:hypothetical protein TRAPUB_5236 [Trametes pubescens]|uniref:Uncharacterized protein n=1 Tax=Trametes pubescens TaxID=154538 RepID=A0A1M2V907_TRAPU|nr:hypothetical protein TRAPUB_5236 [Trametes pubescens]
MASNILKRMLARKPSKSKGKDSFENILSNVHHMTLRYAGGPDRKQLWEEILMHLDDQHHLANVALVCRSLSGVAQEILSNHKVSADTPESVHALCVDAITSRRFANMVRHLDVQCHFDLDDPLVQGLTAALRAFRNLDALVLDIPAFLFAEKCVQNGLLDARLPTLTTLHTNLYVSSQLLEFIGAHSSLTELSLVTCKSEVAMEDASRPQVFLPSLRKLGCDGSFLHYFRDSCTPSELYLATCTFGQLEIMSNAFGPYLRRLHFGHIRTTEPRPLWTLQYFLSSRFPRLEYLQTCSDDMYNVTSLPPMGGKYFPKQCPKVQMQHGRLTGFVDAAGDISFAEGLDPYDSTSSVEYFDFDEPIAEFRAPPRIVTKVDIMRRDCTQTSTAPAPPRTLADRQRLKRDYRPKKPSPLRKEVLPDIDLSAWFTISGQDESDIFESVARSLGERV